MARRKSLIALLCLWTGSAAGAELPRDNQERAPSGPTLQPTALVQLDAVDPNRNGGDYSSFNLRRARLGFAGELSTDLTYAVNVELGGAVGDQRGRLNNLWMEYRGLPPLRFRVGLFGPSQPFEGPSSELTFLERAAPAAIQRSLAGGSSAMAIAAFANGRQWSASAALSGRSIYDAPDRHPLTASARFSMLLRNAQPLVHAGINATLGIRSQDGVVRFSERAETRSTARKVVDTGKVAAEGATALGLEAGAQWRHFLLQGEYHRFGMRRDAAEDPRFRGWYVTAAWTLAGAGRAYRVANGRFESPKPSHSFDPARGHWGALELAARLSRLDLDDPATISGGEERILSLVLNWFLTEQLRMQAGVQRVDAQREPPVRLVTVRSQFAL